MTRTEAVRAAISAELDRRRAAIDADDGLMSITLIVKLERAEAMPGAIVWRMEAISPLRRNGKV